MEADIDHEGLTTENVIHSKWDAKLLRSTGGQAFKKF